MLRISRGTFVSTIVSALIIVSCPTLLHAEGSKKGDPATDPFWNRLMIFAGVDGGYNYVSTSDSSELSKHGYQVAPLGFLSYSFKHFTIDGGGGWLYNRSVGNQSSGALVRDKVTTKAGFVRLAGRYRFTPMWELGVKNHLLLGADARFQTSQPISNHVSWFVGPEAVFRVPLRFPLQFSAAFMTDATISNRQVYQFLVGAQIGFPLQKPRTVATPTPTPTPTPEPTPEPTAVPTVVPTPEPTPAVVPSRTYSFELRPVEFDFDSAKLRPESMAMVARLGRFLHANPEAWGTMIVEGHTDSRGPDEYNRKLSQNRASAVRKVLMEQGIPAQKLAAIGYGESRPRIKAETKVAWQKNRRVDFTVEGIKDPDLLDAFFRELNRKY